MNNKHQYYLKKIPTDWEKVPIEKLGTISSGGTPSRLVPSFWDGSIPWVTPGELTKINSKWLTQTKEYITESGLSDSAAKLMPKGTILVTTRATIGSVAVASIPICTNQGFKSIVPNEYTDSIFYYYLLQFIAPEIVKLSSGSTFDEISRRDFANIVVPRPPIKEQRRIAEILDTVDETIALTSSLIAKLKQIRAGLLHDLLTRGLDEDGKLRDAIAHPEQFKDSPLGRIPKDWRWDMARLLCNEIVVGVVCNATNSYIGQGRQGIPFLRSQNIRPNYIDTNGLLYISSSFNALQSKSILHSGDVIIVRTGYPGTASVVPEELEGANCFSLIVARPNYLILDPHFFAQYLNSENCKTFINRAHFGSAQHNFNIREMDKLPILVPPLSEQVDIVNRINNYDTRICTEEAYLDKLKLQKKGLMHNLLTGKVRVNQI